MIACNLKVNKYCIGRNNLYLSVVAGVNIEECIRQLNFMDEEIIQIEDDDDLFPPVNPSTSNFHPGKLGTTIERSRLQGSYPVKIIVT